MTTLRIAKKLEAHEMARDLPWPQPATDLRYVRAIYSPANMRLMCWEGTDTPDDPESWTRITSCGLTDGSEGEE